MNSIIYLLQVTACTTIFYLFYILFLNRLTFFTTNRWYLLVTVLLSFIIPLIKLPVSQPHVYTGVVQQVVYTYSPQEQFTPVIINPEVVKANPIHWGTVLKITYLAAVLALSIHLIITLITFFKRLENKRITKLGNVNVLSGNEKIANGSFLNYIFLNEQELSADEIQQIMAHELLHIKLCHSVDRILVKLAQIILWFNPFIYLYARSVEENHEFEVDRAIARDTDKHNYANLLLHLSVAGQGMLYHNFSKVPLKKRITMLFNQPSANMKKIVYVLIVPVVLISCLAFAGLKSNDKKNDLFVRTALKKANGDIYDKVTVNLGNHASAKANLLHNGKVGFIFNTKLYNEDDFRVLCEKQGDKIKASAYVGATDKRFFSVLHKMGYRVNTTAYDMIFTIGTLEQTHEKVIADAIKKSMAEQKAKPKPYSNTNQTLSNSDKEGYLLYTRTEIKKTFGESYDIVKIEDSPGSWAETEVPHNAKVGFFINHDFYDESYFKKMLNKNQDFYTKNITALGACDSVAFASLRKQGFNADFTDYAAILRIEYPIGNKLPDTTKYQQKTNQTLQKSMQSLKINKDYFEAYKQTDDYKRKRQLCKEISKAGLITVNIRNKVDRGYRFDWKGEIFTLDLFYGQVKQLNKLLKPGDEVQLKVFSSAFGKISPIDIEPAFVIKGGKKIFQLAEADKIPDYPFSVEANKVSHTDGQITNIKKWPNSGRWWSAVLETVNGYKFNLAFPPSVPDIKGIESGDHVRLRFVHPIKTGAKAYRVTDWISISTSEKDYGVKNPELFSKYYREAKVGAIALAPTNAITAIFQCDSSYIDKARHVDYLYGNANIKHGDIEIISAGYIKYDELLSQIFASGQLKSKSKSEDNKVTFKLKKSGELITADSLKINLKTDKMIAWGRADKFNNSI